MKKELKRNGVENCPLGLVNNLQYHPQNRPTSEQRVKSIKEYIREHGLDSVPPIIVSVKTNNIIDGQHRYAAIKDLLDENILGPENVVAIQWRNDLADLKEEYEAIIIYNATQKKWTDSEYIASHISTNENYRRLHDFTVSNGIVTQKSNKPSYRAALALITGNTIRNKQLRMGELVITDEDIKRGCHNFMEVRNLMDVLPSGKSSVGAGNYIEEFAKGWIDWRDGAGHDVTYEELRRELKRNPKKYQKMPRTSKKYIIEIFDSARAVIMKRKLRKTAQ